MRKAKIGGNRTRERESECCDVVDREKENTGEEAEIKLIRAFFTVGKHCLCGS